MKTFVIAIIVVGLVYVGVAFATQVPEENARYQIQKGISVGVNKNVTIMLDTLTGKTWKLTGISSGGNVWKEISPPIQQIQTHNYNTNRNNCRSFGSNARPFGK